jgi:hypothetical protein
VVALKIVAEEDREDDQSDRPQRHADRDSQHLLLVSEAP